jgi:hypothetical protein
MKAYELTAKINANGELEIPKLRLKHLQQDTPVRIIVLVNEPDADEPAGEENETEFSTESFQRSWQQAVNGETVPLSQLWEGLDVD